MAQKEMRIDKPYLNLPVRPDAPIAWVNWERPDGGLLYELYAELDFDDSDRCCFRGTVGGARL